MGVMLKQSSGLPGEPPQAHLILGELVLNLQPLGVCLPDSTIYTDHPKCDFLIILKMDLFFLMHLF